MERDGFIKNSDMKNKLLIIALWGLTAAVAMILIIQIIEEYVEYNEKEVLQMLVQGIVFVLSVVSLGVYIFFLFGRKNCSAVLLIPTALMIVESSIQLWRVGVPYLLCVYPIIKIIEYILLAWTIFVGFKNKIAFFILSCAILLIDAITWQTYIMVLDIVWFVFGFTNTVPTVIEQQNKPFISEQTIKKTDTVSELKVLNDKLQTGAITQEEYDAKRKEIISKL